MAVSRTDAVKRKIQQSLKPMPFDSVTATVNYSASLAVVHCQVFMSYKGTRMRFDYEVADDEKLPRVDYLRELMWKDAPKIHREEMQKRMKFYSSMSVASQSITNLSTAINTCSSTLQNMSFHFS